MLNPYSIPNTFSLTAANLVKQSIIARRSNLPSALKSLSEFRGFYTHFLRIFIHTNMLDDNYSIVGRCST